MESKLFDRMVVSGAIETYIAKHTFLNTILKCIIIGGTFSATMVFVYKHKVVSGHLVFLALVLSTSLFILLSHAYSRLIRSKYCAGKEKWKIAFLESKRKELLDSIEYSKESVNTFSKKELDNQDRWQKAIAEIDSYLK
ncbi:MAG: hypothetical protein KA028_00820 [Candidatus Pacebacteria bacterium]|nr:hypothetical protein [Candidatus Paceibacterota bacterium]MBP9852063.1 hypothetical protein [Candidatus Paceibacterota bacterium]